MQIDSALNSGYLGLQKANMQVDESSARLAQLATQPDKGDPTTELVDLNVAEQGGQVAAEVVKTADEMMGTLLDIRV